MTAGADVVPLPPPGELLDRDVEWGFDSLLLPPCEGLPLSDFTYKREQEEEGISIKQQLRTTQRPLGIVLQKKKNKKKAKKQKKRGLHIESKSLDVELMPLRVFSFFSASALDLCPVCAASSS